MATTSLALFSDSAQAMACSECRRRELEIAHLRAELSGQRSRMRTWWIALGLLCMAAGPGILLALAVVMDLSLNSPLTTFLAECLWTSFYVPGAILAVLATLSWRPLGQRCLLFVLAFSPFVAVYLALRAYTGEDRIEPLPLGFYPFVILASATPAFLLRLTRRWVVAPPDVDVSAQPTSISTLLVVMTLCAAAATAARGIKFDGEVSISPPILGPIIAAVCVLIPAALLGLAIALALRLCLLESLWRAWPWAVGLTVLTLLILTAPAVVVASFIEVNGSPGNPDAMLAALLGALSVGCTTLALSFASFFYLRLLGYRLVRATGCAPPS